MTRSPFANRCPCAPEPAWLAGTARRQPDLVLRTPPGSGAFAWRAPVPGSIVHSGCSPRGQTPVAHQTVHTQTVQPRPFNKEQPWHNSDSRREGRHDAEVGRRQGRARHCAPCRTDARRPDQDDRARRVHRAAGDLRSPRREEAQQARGRPLREGRRRTRQAARRAAPRLGRRLRGRPGAHGRDPRRRQPGRRHRRQPWQGLRRHHEASQLQGPGRQPRQPQEPPGAGRDRFVRVPGSCVQGHEDVRPHGPRAGHDAQPRGRRGRRRAQRAARQGVGARSQRWRRRGPQRRQGRS